jgi:excisionase family DNA binding protein
MSNRTNAGCRQASAPSPLKPQRGAGGEVTEEHVPLVLNRILTELEEIRATLNGLRKPHYTVEEVADLVGRSAYTVRRWIAEKQILAQRIEGTGPKGRLLVPREELTRLMSQGLGAEMPAVVTAAADAPVSSSKSLPATNSTAP